MGLVPRFAFFAAGVGAHKDRLQAFDTALLAAGKFAHNLVTVSSILPAKCEIIAAEEGFAMLEEGEITLCVMAREDTDIKGRYASASVGVVKVKKRGVIGYLSEYHGDARGNAETAFEAKRMAIEMFQTKMCVELAEDDLERLEGATASIRNDGGGWVSAVALCVFVL